MFIRFRLSVVRGAPWWSEKVRGHEFSKSPQVRLGLAKRGITRKRRWHNRHRIGCDGRSTSCFVLWHHQHLATWILVRIVNWHNLCAERSGELCSRANCSRQTG